MHNHRRTCAAKFGGISATETYVGAIQKLLAEPEMFGHNVSETIRNYQRVLAEKKEEMEKIEITIAQLRAILDALSRVGKQFGKIVTGELLDVNV